MKQKEHTTERDRADSIQRLMALKRHETPDPYWDTRMLAKLRETLAHTAPGMSWGARVKEWLTASPAPLLGAASVAALALLSVSLWFDRAASESMQPAPAVAEIAPPPAEDHPMVGVETPAEEIELYRKPVFVFEYPSNREPVGPLRMGPSSVPVRYDF